MVNLCIAGGTSGAGKTSLICCLLSYFPGAGVVKSSINRYYLGDKPWIVQEERFLTEPDKDTGRYLRSGASKVIFFRCRKEQLSEAIGSIQPQLAHLPLLFWEGNTVIPLLQPDITIMVVSSKGLKPSAKLILPWVNFFVYNYSSQEESVSPDITQNLEISNPRALSVAVNLSSSQESSMMEVVDWIKARLSHRV